MKIPARIAVLPAKYAKFIASYIGLLVAYLEAYGAVWKLVPALLAISAGLGVLATPNKTAPSPAQPPPGNVGGA